MSDVRLTVATCQFASSFDALDNADRICALMTRARGEGADLAHFHECALSGYLPRRGGEPDWRSFDWDRLAAAADRVSEHCARLGMYAAVGAPHRLKTTERPHNALYFIGPAGQVIGRYDKRACSMRELAWFTPGDRSLVPDILGVRIAPRICVEWSFPHLWAETIQEDVDLVLLSADSAGNEGATVHGDVIPGLLQGHAFTNGIRISVANAANREQSFPSLWVHRSGRIRGGAERDMTDMLLGHVTANAPKDDLYRSIRDYRRGGTNGSLFDPYRASDDPRSAATAAW